MHTWAVPLSLFVAVLLALVHWAGYNSGKAVKRLDAACLEGGCEQRLWIGISCEQADKIFQTLSAFLTKSRLDEVSTRGRLALLLISSFINQ